MFADLMAALVESCTRASLVLCAAWALTSVMRRASASTRHFIWICAIAASTLAPAMTAVGPRWTVSIPTPFALTESEAPSNTQWSAISSAPDAAPPAATSDSVTAVLPAGAPAPSAVRQFDLTLAAVLLWAVGATMILAYAISGAIVAWRIRRSAAVIEAPWVDEAQTLAEVFEIPGPVVVAESASVTVPIVCGVWRPSIVMPADAARWSDERRRVVILHELAHIKRRDCLTQSVAQLVCAAYWFNPIVWLAARRMRAERERACDDFVLAAGEKGPDYAAHLLDIAKTAQHRRMSPLVGLAMARPSQLEGRLLAILDPAIRRSSTLHTRVASLAFVLLIAVPVGAVHLERSSPVADEIESASAPPSHTPAAAEESPAMTPLSEPQRRRMVASSSEPVAQRSNRAAADEVSPQVGSRIATAMAAQNAVAADPKTIEALIAALADSDPDVREMVVVTLGRMRDERIVPALLPLLKDSNADVREHVVFALARSGDPRAAAAVMTMIDDASPDVRQQAVHLLGQSRNREAVPVLLKALKDSSADVRQQAVFGLGHLRDASAVEPLLDALKDSSADVRQQAAFALGQIRDPRALPALTAALRDTVADVRQQAAFAIGHIAGQQ
jgi:beta-lactamase regulating signal transducer with metallopeptidase domain/HEAT repeat protein